MTNPLTPFADALHEMSMGIEAILRKREIAEPAPTFAELLGRSREQRTLSDLVEYALNDAYFPPKCEFVVEQMDSTGEDVRLCGVRLYRDRATWKLTCAQGHVQPEDEE